MKLMTSGSEAEMKKAREAHVGGLEPVFVHRDFRPQIYYSAASAHRLAGQMQRAEEMLEGWSKEYPHHPDVFHLMAEVQAQEGRYEKAYEYLRKAVEADPALEEDLSTRIALTLGGTSRAPAELSLVVADFLKSHPSVSGLIDALHLELWPPYGGLDSESRERWRTAALLMHYVPLIEPLQRQALLESAAQGFAKVVELELRKRVFGLFRVEVGRSEDLRSFATKGLSSEDTKVFCRYLLGAGKKERLSLGDILCILDSSSKSGAPIWVRFHQWIQRQNPQLLERVSVLQRVVDLRNPAAHKTLSPDEANTMPRACRDVLTALLHPR